MDQLGCIKRVKATGVSGPGKKIYVRCIKYIGEPGEQKRQELINFSGPDIIDQEEDENEDSDEENEIEEADDLENQDGTEAVVTLQNGLNSVSESLTSTSLYAVPQLDLEQPTSNYLYDLIESSGPQGMSSMVRVYVQALNTMLICEGCSSACIRQIFQAPNRAIDVSSHGYMAGVTTTSPSPFWYHPRCRGGWQVLPLHISNVR